MRTVLMICDKFPPHSVSGSQRPLQFVKHLPSFGYRPYVISTLPEPSDPTDDAPLSELDPRCQVSRPQRLVHYLGPVYGSVRAGIMGQQGPSMASPEQARAAKVRAAAQTCKSWSARGLMDLTYHLLNWALWFHGDWVLPVLAQALRASRRERFELVWASAPNPRNLLAGYVVSQVLRKPLVADIRDPWTYGSLWEPLTAGTGELERFWARVILAHASRTVLTSPLTEAEMRSRFPVGAERMVTITNGFAEHGTEVAPRRGAGADKLLLSYAGTLNDRRRPDVLLDALARLRSDSEFARDVRLQFVGGLQPHAAAVADRRVQDMVIDVGRVDYQSSLAYMRGADVNVLLQTISSGQDVIAGKTFEYLASRRPVLAVVAPAGGDAWLLGRTGGATVVDYADSDAVTGAVASLYAAFRRGDLPLSASEEALSAFGRRRLTGDLAALFDVVLEQG